MEYVAYRVGQNEIEHYGRLGMKWGQHIFGKEKAYSLSTKVLKSKDRKSTKKADKAEKQSAKSHKYSAKLERQQNRLIKLPVINRVGQARSSKKSYKASKKAYRATKSSQRSAKSAKKWAKSMNEVFSDVTVDRATATTEDLDLARKYALKAYGF